ncbi:hypothetical protein Dimus_035307 [Dionaea muscipula]
MTVIHLKKKDVVKSKLRGIEMEFDHEKLATIQERSFMMLRIRIKALQKCKKKFNDELTKFDSATRTGYFGVDPRVLLRNSEDVMTKCNANLKEKGQQILR